MKTISSLTVIGLMLVLALGLVAAVAVGNPDTECQNNGFDYGIVKYECDGGVIENGSQANNYNINVAWTKEIEVTGKTECTSADWTANPAVEGVLLKAGSADTVILSGGLSGTVEKQRYSISHITFCGNYPPMVPEFGTTIGIATALGALGVFFLVRRK